MLVIAFLAIAFQGPTVASRDARLHVGETVAVRGPVASVFTSRAGNVFLNFDRPFPNQTFQGVVFRAAVAAFGGLRRYEGQETVVYGLIKLYNGKPEIVLDSPSQIRFASEPVTAQAVDSTGPTQPVRATRPCVVTVIYDGDTIGCFRLGKIRLLGIDTPEYDQEPFGADARAALAALVAVGDTVQLEQDVDARDQYDRRLAYLWKDGKLVNWLLVSGGWAVQLTYAPNVQYVDWLTDAERRARDEHRGLWAHNGFDCRPVNHRAHRC
jgi:endonuclease YncB( thermonuclease family)